jgi:general L-amino acid transport system substrate-binding protein
MKKVILILIFIISSNGNGTTLEDIRNRGVLNCGVSGSLPGFSSKNKKGEFVGFDVDYCKAIASSINIKKVNYIELSTKNRLTALRDKKIDILSRTTTWTLSRDSSKLSFIGTIFYDGEGFLVPKSFKFDGVSSFSNVSFCIREGTTSAVNLGRYFALKRIKYINKVYPDKKTLKQAYINGECDVYVLDASALGIEKDSLPSPEQHKILDIRISKEPLSPVVRDDDPEWTDIARWTLFLLISLEEYGIKQLDNINTVKALNVEQRNFIDSVGEAATLLNLDNNWGYRVAINVGSYKTIFRKHLGIESKYKLKRGVNSLWTDGGLLYSPPFI